MSDEYIAVANDEGTVTIYVVSDSGVIEHVKLEIIPLKIVQLTSGSWIILTRGNQLEYYHVNPIYLSKSYQLDIEAKNVAVIHTWSDDKAIIVLDADNHLHHYQINNARLLVHHGQIADVEASALVVGSHPNILYFASPDGDVRSLTYDNILHLSKNPDMAEIRYCYSVEDGKIIILDKGIKLNLDHYFIEVMPVIYPEDPLIALTDQGQVVWIDDEEIVPIASNIKRLGYRLAPTQLTKNARSAR